MKYSDITKLKHLAHDKTSRSANPAVVRNSTIFFKSMQELLDKEKLVKKSSKVNFYEYGRAGSQTTIALQNFIAELELAHATFLTSTGFSAVALAIISICRPGDEIVVTDSVYAPTRMITSKLLKEFKIKTHFYNPEDFKSLQSKTNKKTIRALERGIAVLDIINKIGPTSLKSIYEESTLPRPTLLRILHTLEQTGLIRRGLGDGLYRPTFKLEKMAINRHDETDLLAEIAAPTINSLSEHISWPSDLAVLSKEGPFMVLKETSRPNSPFILNIDKIGHKVSLTLSAVGRAYLAYSSPEKINQLVPNTDLIKLKPYLDELGALIQQAGKDLTSDKQSVLLTNASCFLSIFSACVVSWIWLRQANVAERALSTGIQGHDVDFYEGKLAAAEYFLHWELPLVSRDIEVLRGQNATCNNVKASYF